MKSLYKVVRYFTYIQLNLTIGIPSILQFLFQVGALQLWQRHVQQEGREDIIQYLQEYSGKGHEQVENLNIIDEYEQGEAGKLKMIDDFGQEQVGNLNILKFRGRYETQIKHIYLFKTYF